MRRVALLAILPLAACSGPWPTGSYVAMSDDRDATPLSQSIENAAILSVEPGQTLEVVAAQNNDVLTAMLSADLPRRGVTLATANATHRLQYVVAPLDGGMFLRVTIDGKRGGAQFFSRDRQGDLIPAGPFMEYRP
jgi:uncharacterized lipoprotein YmbA